MTTNSTTQNLQTPVTRLIAPTALTTPRFDPTVAVRHDTAKSLGAASRGGGTNV